MDYPALVERQRGYFRSHATQPLEFRRARLRDLEAAIHSHETELLAALRADLGKPPVEAYGSELGMVLAEIRHALKDLPQWMKPRRKRLPLLAWPGIAHARPESRGVALIIGPWNYPFQLLFAPLVGAIAAGDCAILKPSELAPKTSAVMAKLIRDTFSEAYITVVEGGRAEAEALLAERFDFIFFTGSTEVGRAVMTAAARHLTPVTLELGGKSPCIVCAETGLATAARRVVWGKFMNAGQTCIAPDYVLVESSVKEAFLRELAKAVREFYGADPRQSPDYGRIISRGHFERLVGYLGEGTTVIGGEHAIEELYLAPTILRDLPANAPVLHEEIFGPILPVLEFAAFEDALAFLNERPTPLAIYLFSENPLHQLRLIHETSSGGVCINDTMVQILGKDLPFGGVGQSGTGAYHGRASFDSFSYERAVVRRSLKLDLPFRYPPFPSALNAFKRFFRFLMGS